MSDNVHVRTDARRAWDQDQTKIIEGRLMSEPFSRREVLKRFALLVGAAGALRAAPESRAAEAVHLSPTDPAAVALAYHESVKTVNPKEFPTFQPGQSCSNCLQLQGTAGEAWRPCALFPGKLVTADGWCKVWVKKP
jgi:High potential iron-sulfur protein